MILNFDNKWPASAHKSLAGKKTLFKERIWKGLYLNHSHEWKTDAVIPLFIKPKIHVITKGRLDVIKPGEMITFREDKKMEIKGFAPDLPIISIQDFEIRYKNPDSLAEIEVYIDGTLWKARRNAKGVVYEWDVQLMILAQNDGFDTVEDFFAWYGMDFSGNIIHWTDHTY